MSEVHMFVHGEVAIGLDGHLFLVGGNQRVLEFVSGERRVPIMAKKIFYDNIRARGGFCRDHKIAYCHAVCPDKHTVLPQYFPFDIKVSLGIETLSYCRDEFLFPVQELSAVPGGAYLRTDTHWTVGGQLAFVKVCLNRLGINTAVFEGQLESLWNLVEEEATFCGDLGQKLTPKRVEARQRSRRPPGVLFLSNNPVGNVGALHLSITHPSVI